MYSLSDFDFDLPPERIAQVPLPDRSASRLLQLDGDRITDRHFADIVDQLQAGDVLVMNNTRVLKARFFGQKESGGQVEVLVERVLDNRTVLAQVRASKSPKPGTRIRLADAFERLGAGHLVHEVKIDVDEVRLPGITLPAARRDDVIAPHLLGESPWVVRLVH